MATTPATPILPFGSPQSLVKQSVGLFAASKQRRTMLNRLCGTFPTEKDAIDKMKMQTSTDYPIVRNMDLTKAAGDRITFDLINPTFGKVIMGDAFAQGNGNPMSFAQDGLHINLSRYPVAGPSTMSQQRTLHDLVALARGNALSFINDLLDQRTLVHLAGARGFHMNGEWRIPLAADSDFASTMINPVRAPSKNRHYMCSGGEMVPFAASGNEVSMVSTDLMSTTLIDSLSTWLDETPFPPAPVKFDGDELANDENLRVLLVSPGQYTAFLQSPMFRTWQANSAARAAVANRNPLMMGDAGLWRGILIKKMPKPIRFYAGNAINHCGSTSSQTETTTDLVPAAFGTSFAIDRALLIGAQSLGQALGKTKLTSVTTGEEVDGMPIMYGEALMDYGARVEVMVGTVDGMSKTQFMQDFGTSKQFTDFGVVSIDTVVAPRS